MEVVGGVFQHRREDATIENWRRTSFLHALADIDVLQGHLAPAFQDRRVACGIVMQAIGTINHIVDLHILLPFVGGTWRQDDAVEVTVPYSQQNVRKERDLFSCLVHRLEPAREARQRDVSAVAEIKHGGALTSSPVTSQDVAVIFDAGVGI